MLVVLGACGDADSPAGQESGPRVSTTTTTTTTVLPTTAPPATTAVTESEQPTSTEPPVTTTTLAPRSLDDLRIEPSEAGSGFSQPVLMVTPPGDDRWFVVDQPGVIWLVADGTTSVFLDIEDLVAFQGEQGLLGMAFHPGFADNGLVYVNYINNAGDTIVAVVQSNGTTAQADSLAEVLRVDQPAGNHNGGMLPFGPDENLWIGLGDGGGANDQFGQGQRAETLLAAMVRIAVGPGIDGYEVPAGNLENEVWATGLRNPWRFAFDGDDLWIADVGQNRIEEVDVVDWTAGNPNFGWSVMEGTECFGGGSCESTGLVMPVYEYTHDEGCSVTGGFVYRGAAMPELAGHYLFADYCTGWLRSVDKQGDVREWLPAGTFSGVTGFGQDAAGEIYVLTSGGKIFALVPTE